MKRGVRVYFYIAGGAVLLALAGCGRSFLQGERAAWRHDAEVTCLKSGTVKIGVGVEQMQPIAGPGMCGADFPLKVALLGEGTAMSYADELRPPAAIPNASPAQPRWPPSEQRYAPPVQSEPIQSGNMRWVPGPQGIARPETTAPARYAPPTDRDTPSIAPSETPAGQPMSIYAPGIAQPDDVPDDTVPPSGRAAPSYPRTQPAYNAPVYQPPQRAPRDDIPHDAVLPPGRRASSYPHNAPAYNAPLYQPPPQRTLPALGPMRGPNAAAASMPAAVTPPATLACPMVSALDRWVSEGVQPAALRWFGSQVTEIRQIGSYSCREMVGSGTSHMSEHAFGDALDIAGFTLADGRKITVKNGWRGTPEEQGFLHDVQLYACETFTTVLAPGYNVYHYDHIHVDLMRRRPGYRPCRPDAIPGEVAAAKARSLYASKHHTPVYTGSLAAPANKLPLAVPGQDGYVAGDDDDAVTGSIGGPTQPAFNSFGAAGDAAIRLEELRSKPY